MLVLVITQGIISLILAIIGIVLSNIYEKNKSFRALVGALTSIGISLGMGLSIVLIDLLFESFLKRGI